MKNRNKPLRKILRFLTYIILGIYTIVCLYPLIWLLFYSLKTNEEIFVTNPFGPPLHPHISNYIDALTKFNFKVYFKNSIFVTIIAMAIGITCSLLFAYVIARLKNKKTNFLYMYIIAGMFIPIQVIMVPLVIMIKDLGLSHSLLSLIVPYIALNFPFAVMVLYGFYRNIPIEFEESATIDGAGFYKCFFSVILPQVKPALAILIVYQFMGIWNEFGLAVVLIHDDALRTLPLGLVALAGQYSTQWGPIGAALVLASAPVLILYIIFSDKVQDVMMTSGMKD